MRKNFSRFAALRGGLAVTFAAGATTRQILKRYAQVSTGGEDKATPLPKRWPRGPLARELLRRGRERAGAGGAARDLNGPFTCGQMVKPWKDPPGSENELAGPASGWARSRPGRRSENSRPCSRSTEQTAHGRSHSKGNRSERPGAVLRRNSRSVVTSFSARASPSGPEAHRAHRGKHKRITCLEKNLPRPECSGRPEYPGSSVVADQRAGRIVTGINSNRRRPRPDGQTQNEARSSCRREMSRAKTYRPTVDDGQERAAGLGRRVSQMAWQPELQLAAWPASSANTSCASRRRSPGIRDVVLVRRTKQAVGMRSPGLPRVAAWPRRAAVAARWNFAPPPSRAKAGPGTAGWLVMGYVRRPRVHHAAPRNRTRRRGARDGAKPRFSGRNQVAGGRVGTVKRCPWNFDTGPAGLTGHPGLARSRAVARSRPF